ncbi:MAG: hypothetical protein L0220_24180 [Acidobacteria bacterium]|nr:hypothetical protein [Acidobacteriota bacterium]
MPDKDVFTDRERAMESAYFQKKDQELIEKLRQRAALDDERRKLSEELGNLDEELIDALQNLGFTRETLPLLHLTPLVQMAWAEGKVTDSERKLIFEIAEKHGISKETPAYQKLNEWLENQPPEQFFEHARTAIYLVNQTLPPEKQVVTTGDILTYCTRIAEASGGLLGIGNKISPEERDLMQKIITQLQREEKG